MTIEKITQVLEANLPKSFIISVTERKQVFGGNSLKISFRPNNHLINGVSGQYPQVVSLRLDLDDNTLEPQIYGGNGGRCIYRNIDPNNPSEKYLAMKSVKIPFRKPKNEEKFILKAIEKFAQNYIKTLKDNFELLRYKDVVDYSFLD